MTRILLNQWHRLLRAWQESDWKTLESALSVRSETTWAGPEPSVIWQGRVTIMNGLRGMAPGCRPAGLTTQYLVEHTEADWGWVVYAGRAGTSLLRASSIWVREANAWRLFMLHADWSEGEEAAVPVEQLLTGTQQTMRSWARLIESPAQVPSVYRAVFSAGLDPRAPFPYTVLVPAFTEEPHLAIPEQLIYEQADELHILVHDGEQVSARVYRLSDVCSVEMGLVLLQSWVTIEGRTTDGVWATTTLAFSTASSALVIPFVQHLRTAGRVSALQAVPRPLAELEDKFALYARECLLPEERLLAWLWRPDITLDTMLSSLWPFYRADWVNHLTMLTDREVILIWDRVTEMAGEEEAYGAVWRYIPLQRITDVTVQEDASGTPHLVLTLCDAVTLKRRFTANQRIELDELVQKITTAMQYIG